MTHQIVSHEEWLKARKAFLEKDFVRAGELVKISGVKLGDQ